MNAQVAVAYLAVLFPALDDPAIKTSAVIGTGLYFISRRRPLESADRAT